MLGTEQAHIQRMASFAQLPAIRPLATEGRWTVSDSDKRPIDLWSLEHKGELRGCKLDVPYSTRTLDDLVSFLPNAANFAFYMDSDEDGVCILDIEPECPDEIKRKFLKAPCLYAERSLSGRGYHLLLPYPEKLMSAFPAAAQKKSMKNASEGWEILFEHWVTFTADTIDTSSNEEGAIFLEEQLASLFSVQRELSYDTVDVTSDRPEDIPHASDIARIMRAFVMPTWLTPDKYSNDLSTFEFSVAMQLLRSLRIAQEATARWHADSPAWTDEHTAWLLYEALSYTLPHRDKHDCSRKGLPWLLYLATRAVGAEHARGEEGD